jgi:hypothetical protein
LIPVPNIFLSLSGTSKTQNTDIEKAKDFFVTSVDKVEALCRALVYNSTKMDDLGTWATVVEV